MEKPAAKTQQEKTEIEQLSQSELVELVMGLQKIIQELQEKLAIATDKSRTNSKTSSQPPSLDLIQKSEKAKDQTEEEQKKKPGGQLGHQGKTRKGFGRVDRYEISNPSVCQGCGSRELSEAISHQTQQVACLVAKWATHQSNVHVDETPWCVMGVKEWLWTASGEGFCLFHAADTRGRVELETMLGTEFTGVLSSDDFSSQVGYAAGLLLKSLRDKADQWWYFLDDPNVPPDNNLAERSLRLAVTKRKVCGGSRSMERFEQTAALLSVIQTCRFQARSAMTFFREAISAHSCDLAMPFLIPLLPT